MLSKSWFVALTVSLLFLPGALLAQVGMQSEKECLDALAKVQPTATNSDEVLRDANIALWQIAQTGTEVYVPEVARLLNIDSLNCSVRIALKNIPGAKALAALRKGLETSTGNNRIGVIQTLAEMNDTGSIPAIIAFAKSNDPLLAGAALNALAKLGGAAAEEQVVRGLASKDGFVRAAAADATLYFVERYRTSGETAKAKALIAKLTAAELSEAQKSIVQKANDRVSGKSYPASIRPKDVKKCGTAAEFTELLKKYSAASGPAKEALAQEALIWCRDSEPGSGYEDLLETQLKSAQDEQEKIFLLDLLVQVGTKRALAKIAGALSGASIETVDRITQIFGEWITLDAKKFLAELARNYPNQKYQTRAVRGYARLVRQMLDTSAPKLAMINELLPLLKTSSDKKILTDLATAIEKTRRDRLVFDGKTFNGWEGNKDLFRIENGVIIGGFADKPVPRNEFLCTTNRYRDFTITLECRLEGKGGNAGIQFRSERIPNHFEMTGFQADMTEDGSYWGSLYDESRRNKFLAQPTRELIKKIYKPGEWNEYRIVCWGNRIKIYLNGTLTVDYIEKDSAIPLEGVIGLQIHKGGPSQSFYRNIRIEAYNSRQIR